MSTRSKVVVCVLLLGTGYAAAWFTKPESVKEVVKYKEAKDVIIVRTRIVYADGSTKEQEVIKDKSQTTVDKETSILNHRLGVRAALLKKLGSQEAYSLELHSPPLVKIFSAQLGIAANADTEAGHVTTGLGIYVQF